MNLPKIHSITKKICVALLGGFLLIFLLFHASANLCILRHDDGAWYSAFCHFMGTNYIVKTFEIVLIGAILLHILLTVWLWLTNQLARPVKYHQPSKTKTHTGSKIMIWTGILILAILIVHFCDFYFVKLGLVKGKYMAQTEEINKNQELSQFVQACAQYGVTPDEFIASNEEQIAMYAEQLNEEQLAGINEQLDKMREMAPLANVLAKYDYTAEQEWVKGISYEDRKIIRETSDIEVEPDFYNMTREKFQNPIYALIYLVFFVIVWFHLRHAFASVFQTIGLSNYKYGNAIEIIAQIYAWAICLIFAAVVILVFCGL